MIKPIDTVCLIMEIADTFRKFGDEAGESLQIGTNEYGILWMLRDAPGKTLPVSVIREGMGLPSPSLSRIISRLTSKGYLARALDSEDSRRVAVTVTSAGEKAFLVADEFYRRNTNEIFGRLQAGMAEKLHQQLESLRTSLQKHQ